MQLWGSTRRLQRLAMALGILVAIVLIVNGFMALQTELRLKGRMAVIRAAGDPASISDLAPAPIPPDQNAAVILDRIGPRLDAFSKEHSAWGNTPLGEDHYQRGNSGEPATNEQIDAIRAILEKYADITAALSAAAKCEKYASTADYTANYQKFLDDSLQNQVGRVRTAARFLNWSGEVAIADGQHERAVEQGIQLMRLARHYDSEPLLVNYLVSIAIRGHATQMLYDGLAAGPVSPELHTAVEQELALHDTSSRIIHALKTDRAYSASVASKAVWGPEMKEVKIPLGGLVFWPMKRHFIGAMDYLDSQLAIVAASWPKPNMRVGSSGAEVNTGMGTMADLLVPALQASYAAEARIVSVMRSLRIFNALREFAEKNGREAKGLDEIELPPAATTDPFSGKPLSLRHTEDGWIVYSVMENRVDDGGDFNELKDYGVAPVRHRLTEKPAPPEAEDAAASDQ
jgi:hypothetical protein